MTFIYRLIFFVILALVSAYGVNYLWDPSFGIVVGVLIISIPLIYSYVNLQRLRKYISINRIENMPSAVGIWGEIFYKLQRQIEAMKMTERSVRDQHQRFMQAFQASPNAIVMLDDKFQIEWCNANAELFFGINISRDSGQKISYLVRHPEFIDYLNLRVFDGPLLLTNMGNLGNQSLMIQIFPFAENKSLLLAQDVTDLQKADAMRRDFVANVSHEMRTPLTVMMGFLETIQSIDLDKVKQSEYIATMLTQAKRMKSLVDDLLALANLEGGSAIAPKNEVHVGHMMAILKEEADALTRGRHILKYEIEANWDLLGEEKELQSAFSNLISNAIRYTPDGGQIQVTLVKNEKNQIEFCVKDSGPGIAPEHLNRLTERFYRVDKSRSRETGGTGLGLAIVKHIATRHQALLSISSNLGEGSSFKLIFPNERVKAL